MAADALFPPTPAERVAALAAFVTEERKYRGYMLGKYRLDAGQVRYWSGRVAQCDEAFAHLAALAEAVGP
jgi:hypothetical protein